MILVHNLPFSISKKVKIGLPSATPRRRAFGRERDRLSEDVSFAGASDWAKSPGWILHSSGDLLIYCWSVCADGFVLCGGSCSDDHFADSPGDQLGLVKMDPVSAVARH